MKAEILKKFCEKLNLNQTSIQETETLDKWILSKELPAESIKNLQLDDYQSVISGFTNSLSMSIGYPSGINLLEINEGVSVKDLNDSIEDIKKRPDKTDLNVEISVNKNELLQNIGITTLNQTKYYIFKSNLLKLTKAPLLDIDKLLFKSKFQPYLIIVSEECPNFDGFLLNVIQESDYQAFNQSKLIADQDKTSQLLKFYGDHLTKPSWIGFNFDNLTPFHFVGDWQGEGKEEFETANNIQLQKMCVIFTANRCSYNDSAKQFQAIYANSERAITLDLSDSVQIQSRETLTKIVDWISEGKDKDKLTIFQNVTARILNDENPEDNYDSFSKSLTQIYNESQWNYRLYVDGQINKHFDEVQKFSGWVAETAKKVSDSIDTVTKSITDALLATVGVLIATVLAAIAKDDATVSIFRISFTAYAFYLIFYVIYRMVSLWHGYWIFVKDTDEQETLYKSKLGNNKVIEILKPITRRKFQFRIWFLITLAIYTTLIIAIFYAAGNLPGYLIEKGLIKPKTVTMPQPSPELLVPGNTANPPANLSGKQDN